MMFLLILVLLVSVSLAEIRVDVYRRVRSFDHHAIASRRSMVTDRSSSSLPVRSALQCAIKCALRANETCFRFRYSSQTCAINPDSNAQCRRDSYCAVRRQNAHKEESGENLNEAFGPVVESVPTNQCFHIMHKGRCLSTDAPESTSKSLIDKTGAVGECVVFAMIVEDHRPREEYRNGKLYPICQSTDRLLIRRGDQRINLELLVTFEDALFYDRKLRALTDIYWEENGISAEFRGVPCPNREGELESPFGPAMSLSGNSCFVIAQRDRCFVFEDRSLTDKPTNEEGQTCRRDPVADAAHQTDLFVLREKTDKKQCAILRKHSQYIVTQNDKRLVATRDCEGKGYVEIEIGVEFKDDEDYLSVGERHGKYDLIAVNIQYFAVTFHRAECSRKSEK